MIKSNDDQERQRNNYISMVSFQKNINYILPYHCIMAKKGYDSMMQRRRLKMMFRVDIKLIYKRVIKKSIKCDDKKEEIPTYQIVIYVDGFNAI